MKLYIFIGFPNYLMFYDEDGNAWFIHDEGSVDCMNQDVEEDEKL